MRRGGHWKRGLSVFERLDHGNEDPKTTTIFTMQIGKTKGPGKTIRHAWAPDDPYKSPSPHIIGTNKADTTTEDPAPSKHPGPGTHWARNQGRTASNPTSPTHGPETNPSTPIPHSKITSPGSHRTTAIIPPLTSLSRGCWPSPSPQGSTTPIPSPLPLPTTIIIALPVRASQQGDAPIHHTYTLHTRDICNHTPAASRPHLPGTRTRRLINIAARQPLAEPPQPHV